MKPNRRKLVVISLIVGEPTVHSTIRRPTTVSGTVASFKTVHDMMEWAGQRHANLDFGSSPRCSVQKSHDTT